ncbi:MAG: HAD family phosphatase [Anaerolineae bacterium]|nr:HAD family phosphatase [Anaerolineae bacterium]
MSIYVVIWDLGGVLVRTEDWGPRTRLAARLNLSVDQLSELVFGPAHDLRAQLGEISYDEHWRQVADSLGLPPERMDGLRAEFFAGDRLDDHLIEYIRGLKRTYTIALLSNALSNLRALIFEEWSIDDAFHHLTISAEIGLVKPDPAIYQYTLEQLGFEPYETVLVDDMPDNVAAARRLGMHAIRFRQPDQMREQLQLLLNDKALELP